ncbi:MAG: D-alanyl-D-alanine carboxypeptidase, partial [Pseudomonadota bacterium]
AKDAGFSRLAGQFFVDAGAITRTDAIDPEQPVDAAYNPGVSALNLNFNRARIKWTRQGVRVSAKAIRLDPEIATIRVARAAAPNAPLFLHQNTGLQENWQMSQEAMRRPGERWLPVKQPALYAGEVFRGLAATYGMTLGAPAKGAAEGARVLALQESRPLSLIIRDMLKFSTNLTAESVGLTASRGDSLAASANAMNAWVAETLGLGRSDPGFRLVNHSGLTTKSRVSPQRMTDLLRVLAARPGQSHPRLPGPLAGFLKPHNVAADSVPLDYDTLDVVAKTGTMDYIRGLAGYVATPGGRRFAFAIFCNDLARRAGGVRQVNRGWLGRARGLERRLIRNWILRADG